MSSSSRSDGNSFDEEILQIGTKCREKLELHVKQLSEARTEDKRHIQRLERELLNSSQEIDYLQDQLNARNQEVYTLEEYVHELELKLVDMEALQASIGQLSEELKRSNSEHLLLVEELEKKEIELQESTFCMEKLEESISSLTLDSQCEIECMKLEMIALKQACFKTGKALEESNQENARVNRLIEDLQFQIFDTKENNKSLEKENKELIEKLVTCDVNYKLFIQQIEEWLENDIISRLNSQSYASEAESKSNASKEMRACKEALGPVLSKLATVLGPKLNLEEQMERMSHQISKYEVLVKHLKDELKEEKSKAKEEAEDLAQEMAELRYRMTGLLEEECKRRACIEQASLQRISELEAQIQKERRNFFCICQASP